jgi:GrpB-like predicted nucleotidyltransferase (UPF0157 family)
MPASVVIVDYNKQWPRMFAAEAQAIKQALGAMVQIEHVGSTAVPQLAAKPIIDIMLGIEQLTAAPQLIAPLHALGYTYVPEYEAVMPDRRYFRKGPPAGRTHHLHLVERTSRFWEQQLLFRDWLRTHPVDAARYAALKRELAERYRHDRHAYTDAKTALIESIERRAREHSTVLRTGDG